MYYYFTTKRRLCNLQAEHKLRNRPKGLERRVYIISSFCVPNIHTQIKTDTNTEYGPYIALNHLVVKGKRSFIRSLIKAL